MIFLGSFMRYFFLLIIGLAVCAAAQTFPREGLSDHKVSVRAFVNGTIVTGNGAIIEKGAILVRDGYIAGVGQKVSLPPGTPVIDLKGAYVYPGFIDLYSRYGMPEIPKNKNSMPRPRAPHPQSRDKEALAWNEAINSHADAAELFTPNAAGAKSLREQGFTLVQTNMRDGIFQGQAAVVLLNDGRAHDNVLPERGAQFLSFSKGSSRQDYPNSLMGAIALIRQTLYDAQWYERATAAYRANPAQKKPEFNRALEALLPVVQKKTPLLFGAANYLDVQRAARIADEFGLEMILKTGADSYKRLADLKALKKALVVPLTFPPKPDVSDANASDNVSLAALKHWDSAPEAPARLARAGIPFALTADGLKKGQTFLGQLRLAVKRGLDEDKALAALTVIPARLAGIDDKAGDIARGKLANFIIAGGNLFRDDKSVIRRVVVAGKVHDVNPLPEFDWRGTWQLSSDWGNIPLEISGKIEKPDVFAGRDSNRVKLKKSVLSKNHIKLSLPATFNNAGGVIRLAADRFGLKLQGYVLDGQGRRHPLSGERRAAHEDKEKTTTKKEDVAMASFPTVFPDKAYGLSAPPEQPSWVLIRKATLWTATERGILEDYDLLIKKGRIHKIGRGLKAPKGARVIDAGGKHVTPGIIDEHSHIAIDRGVNEGSQAITAEVRIGDVLNPDNIHIYRQLAGGVTTSQLLHGSANPIGGQAQVIKLRWGANAAGLKFKAAPPTIKFALGENVKQSNWGDMFRSRYPQTRMGVKELFIDAFERARAYEKEWQAYKALSSSARKKTVPPRRDLELDALVEILNSRRTIHCHSYVQSEILGLMEVAERFGFRVGTFTHILEGYKVAREMAAHGAMASTFADWWDYKFEVYEAIPYNSALMVRGGVIASVNSDDAEMARRLNQEAAKAMTYGGLSPEEAIKLVTINPARQLKVEERVGSLEAGKDADIVIWSGSPLSGYSHVEQTWIEGRKYFDIGEDRQRRREIAEQRNVLIQKALKDKTPAAGKAGAGEKKARLDYRCDDMEDFLRDAQ